MSVCTETPTKAVEPFLFLCYNSHKRNTLRRFYDDP